MIFKKKTNIIKLKEFEYQIIELIKNYDPIDKGIGYVTFAKISIILLEIFAIDVKYNFEIKMIILDLKRRKNL